jgi:ribosomal protein S18 acetylase RimI-like enzyme
MENIEIIRHSQKLPPLLLELLKAYPCKKYQNQRLGLDSVGLARYQWDLAQKINLEKHPFYTGEKGGRCYFCFGLRKHDWHSEFFGRRIARASHLLFSDEPGDLRRAAGQAIVAKAAEEGIDLVQVRVDVEDRGLSQTLIRAGFQIVGHSVKLGVLWEKLDSFPRISDNLTDDAPHGPAGASTERIRPIREGDLARLQEVARRSHQRSHFFNDPGLDQGKVSELFPEWLKKCAEGAAAQILVIQPEGVEQPVGFVTLLLNRRLRQYCGRAAGVVDFIAIDPGWQGRGYGKKLLRAGMQWLSGRSDYIEIRTELNNYPAIRLYQRQGLEVLSADVELHCWVGQ